MMGTIKSQIIFKPKFRLPYQTTAFIYKALDAAEDQVKELLDKVEQLEKENRRLSKVNSGLMPLRTNRRHGKRS